MRLGIVFDTRNNYVCFVEDVSLFYGQGQFPCTCPWHEEMVF